MELELQLEEAPFLERRLQDRMDGMSSQDQVLYPAQQSKVPSLYIRTSASGITEQSDNTTRLAVPNHGHWKRSLPQTRCLVSMWGWFIADVNGMPL